MLSFNQQQSQSDEILDIANHQRTGILRVLRTILLFCWSVFAYYLLNVIWNIYQLARNDWSQLLNFNKVLSALDLPWPLTIPVMPLWIRIALFVLFALLLGGCAWATNDVQRELRKQRKQEVDEDVTLKLQNDLQKMGVSHLFPRVRKAPFDIMRLPPPEYFVGRSEDSEWLLERLRTKKPSVSVLTGLAGIGKTALASSVVRTVYDEGRFRGGIVVLQCQKKSDAIEVLQNVLFRFDPQCHQMDLPALQNSVNRLFDGKDILIVLDNVEAKLDIETVITTLRVSKVKLLTTSQHRLPSHLVSVESHRTLEELAPEDAYKLFIKPLGNNSMELSPEKQEAVKRIVEILGFHTLAVKLAGAQAVNLNRDLETFARELQNPVIAIEVSDSDAPSAVKRAFAESIKDLPPRTRRLFVALAAFPTIEFSRGAVIALAESIEPGKGVTNVNALIMRALVVPFPNENIAVEEDRERLRLHPLLYSFALTLFKGLQDAEQQSIQLTVAKYYADYADRTSDFALSYDEGNIAGMLEWAHTQNERGLERTIIMRMDRFWIGRGPTPEVLSYIQRGITVAEDVATQTMASHDHLQASKLKLSQGRRLFQIGKIDDAERIFQDILTTQRMLGDTVGEGEVRIALGQLEQQRGHLATAMDHYEQGLDLLGEVGKPFEGLVLRCKGDIIWQQGGREDAEIFYQQSLEIARAGTIADCKNEAQTLVRTGEIAQMYRQYRQAGDRYREALRIVNHPGSDAQDQQVTGHIHRCLAGLAQVNGRFSEASDHYDEALKIARDVRDRLNEGMVLAGLGNFAHEQKRFVVARDYHRQSLEIAREVQYKQGEGRILWHMGNLARTQTELQDAEEYYLEALRIARSVEDIIYCAHSLLSLGTLFLEQKRASADGDEKLREAISYYVRMNLPHAKEALKTAQRLGVKYS